MLLGFSITTQKPIEIFQVSCKKKNNHTSACVSDDTSSPTLVSDDTSNPVHVSDDIGELIRLWHVSPIRLRHVLLTHPQTPINRSLPKAFGGDQDSEVQKLCRNQASKSSRTSRTLTPKSKNIWSRIIQTICLDPKVCGNQAQKPPKTSINHKSVKLYGSKPLKPRRTSTTNLQRQRIHEEHEEREEQMISNKLIARDSL